MSERELLLVEFRVGQQRFAAAAETIVEILRMVALSPVPSPGPHVRGAMNLRGAMVTVADLRRLLGAPEEDRADTPILIVEAGGASVGLVADEVFNVEGVAADRIQDRAAADPLPDFVTGVLLRDEGITYVAELAKLVEVLGLGVG